ncbi:MAG: glutamate synthase subunit alpha, partial [Oscillochloris sp.]|nr:glutamate synthase subunit alpha [Oscillochloris sp.]
MTAMQLPERDIHGLYDPRFEHDACGIGFVARISGKADHSTLSMALEALCNLEHRGAVADDAKTGDGAGVLVQLPRELLLRELAAQGRTAEPDRLALGMFFLPQDEAQREAARAIAVQAIETRGFSILAWRDVPVNPDALGARSREAMPYICQAIIERPSGGPTTICERGLYLARKQMEAAFVAQRLHAYVPSLSANTVVYKGLLLGTNLADFYDDLRDPAFLTAIAVYHQRYSTNTFPTWERAQPFRMLSHNGEINTIQGNANWMHSREAELALPEDFIPGRPDESALLTPVLDTDGSDSTQLDNALEMIVIAGRDIRHAMTMLVPEAWEKIPDLSPALRAFYQYHACLIEPWDGPAALTFSDGRIVGTTLDRNGLRPARYIVTDDGLVISGSEVGAVQIDDARIVHKGKLGPGQMIAVDTVSGQFYTDEEIKASLAARQPYDLWLSQHMHSLESLDLGAGLSAETPEISAEPVALSALQMAFGYTSEELNVVVRPMLTTGQEPIGSMGDDTPSAVISQLELGRPLFQFFKQRFAEVTNPPIDSLREDLVMSLSVAVGIRRNLLAETPEHCHLLQLTSPV